MAEQVSGPLVLDRRSFLRLAGVGGGGLLLACFIEGPPGLAAQVVRSAADPAEGSFAPNAYLSLAPDGLVTLYSARPELGQGIKTSLPMIVAEELDVDWRSVRVVSAPTDPVYGVQGAGGSSSTPKSYAGLRLAGATARAMLVRAAAQAWAVPEDACSTGAGQVRHKASGRAVSYGSLAGAAARLPAPEPGSVRLKDPKRFTLIGSRIGGVDNPQVVTGKALFGIDQKVPGMLHAVYERCPVWGGTVKDANLGEVKALPGVRDAFVVEKGWGGLTGLVPGVAIVADSTWAAFSARRKLKVAWDEGRYAHSSWESFGDEARALARAGMKETRRDGDVDAVFADPRSKVLEAEYSHAFVAHATLEPQNCTAHVRGDRADIRVPSQEPTGARQVVAEFLGIPVGNVSVVNTRVGGAFGRRGHHDFVLEAVAIARRSAAPVKLTWSREDDMAHDHYRPGGFHFLKAALDGNGRLAAWSSQEAYFESAMPTPTFPAGFVANCLLRADRIDNGIPMGPWRAPGDNSYAFVIGSFLDELAHAAGRDPLEFNLEVLANRYIPPPGKPLKGWRGAPYDAPRMAAVLGFAARKAGWGRKLERGRGMGLGYFYDHAGYVAEVAEVTVSKDGALTVDRVVVAADVGSQIVNLSGAEGQAQGSVIDGLSAAWRQELDIRDGRVAQSNFHEYPLLRIPDAPRKLEIHFPGSDNPPTGLGEPCLPPLAPAVANAIFAATGVRIRRLPFSRTDLRWSA